MTDLRTKFDLSQLSGDLSKNGLLLEQDDSLKTAVVISLFTDQRAKLDDFIPGNSTDLRGWWGDAWSEISNKRIGSRLWLLSREKQLPDVLVRAKQYAEEALQWLIDQGIVNTIEVTATFSATSVLALQIQIVRPYKSAIDYKFNYIWETGDAYAI
ncbi:MAG: phage GP46 family protein [Alphaproteobacteria bacterium]|nr:phage GP46 family protein [Alphaproteobacteria bacterium]MDD9919787.1 phage GP46 family protein [Alphaproteobacteria bacterium]